MKHYLIYYDLFKSDTMIWSPYVFQCCVYTLKSAGDSGRSYLILQFISTSFCVSDFLVSQQFLWFR